MAVTDTGYQVDLRLDGDEVLAEIRERLAHDAALDARQIRVSLAELCIYLDGWVTDARSRERAEQLARSVVGVGDLENRLEVQITDVEDKPLIPPRR